MTALARERDRRDGGALSNGPETIEIRDLSNLAVKETIEMPDGEVTGIWTGSSGVLIAAGNRKIRIWDHRIGAFLPFAHEHPLPVAYARFPPDGSWLLTVVSKQNIRVFSNLESEPLFGPLQVAGAASYDVLPPDFSNDNEEIRARGKSA